MTFELPEAAILALRTMSLQRDSIEQVDDLPLAHLQLRLQPILRALRVAVEARTGRTARLLNSGRGLGSDLG